MLSTGAYIKIGNGTNLDLFDYKGNNNIKSQIGTSEYPIILTNDTSSINLEANINDSTESEITEVGVFSSDDNLIFVSYMDQVYKKEEFDFKYILRVNK